MVLAFLFFDISRRVKALRVLVESLAAAYANMKIQKRTESAVSCPSFEIGGCPPGHAAEIR
jgi:hypothetical protein